MRRFGMPMGPLELLDQVGLDVAANIAKAMEPVFGARFDLQPAFAIMDEKRWLDGLYLDAPEEWDDPYRFFRW